MTRNEIFDYCWVAVAFAVIVFLDELDRLRADRANAKFHVKAE
jgi:hypothetical protein